MRRLAVFRVNASIEVGMGHLQRCRTLADELTHRGWRIGFACCPTTLQLVPALSADDREIVTMPPGIFQEQDAMRRAWSDGVDVLIIDHYQRDGAYEASCRPWAQHIVAIDDMPARWHDADLLLDQTVGRSAEEYRDWVREPTYLAVGGKFILLRPEIRRVRRTSVEVAANVRNIIVTFGGSDRSNLSARALAAFRDARLKYMTAWLVLGPGNTRCDELQAAVPPNVHVVVNPPDFPEIMVKADLALAAAGTSCWELAHLGIPAILVTESPGNVAQALETAGAARWLGREADVDANMMADAVVTLAAERRVRQAMADAGRRLVDGRGAERAAAAIEDLCR